MTWQPTTPSRFWSRVDATAGLFACWPWVGGRTDKGYGKVGVNGRDMKANRVAWLFTFGPIPDGLNVLHDCDNAACCNPAHLHLGTVQDNNREMLERGRYRNGEMGKTHCKRGHEFAGWNLVTSAGRHRSCRTCSNARRRVGFRSGGSDAVEPVAVPVAVPALQHRQPAPESAPPYALITHCIRGHEFTPENTRWRGTGHGRWCRMCRRLSRAEYRRRRIAA